ncbi:MAG: radical SAM protein [Muribaculaceae bacterium]|nr:radical SAM protein [Muribaculaceae bacterium]
MNLKVFDICREGTHVLGPGNRYVVWVQGCLQRCRGCITPESRTLDGGITINTADLAADIILADNIDGITISGGEPFLQSEALANMLDEVRKTRPELTVIIYTGYQLEILNSLPKGKELIKCADVIIDGPYIENLNDNRGIRGSSNQRINSVTTRLDSFISQMEHGRRKQSRVMREDGMVTAIGVPSRHISKKK